MAKKLGKIESILVRVEKTVYKLRININNFVSWLKFPKSAISHINSNAREQNTSLSENSCLNN